LQVTVGASCGADFGEPAGRQAGLNGDAEIPACGRQAQMAHHQTPLCNVHCGSLSFLSFQST